MTGKGTQTQKGELLCLLVVLAAAGALMGAVVTRVIAAERSAGADAAVRSTLATIADSVRGTLQIPAFSVAEHDPPALGLHRPAGRLCPELTLTAVARPHLQAVRSRAVLKSRACKPAKDSTAVLAGGEAAIRCDVF